MKDKISTIGKFYYCFPQAVAFIGCEGNIMPAAWHTPISAHPPLYGVLVSPKRHTYSLLNRKRGFTVNFMNHDQACMSADTGSTSGRDIDKLETYRIEHEMGERINGPILTRAYAAYECEHHAVQELGDHFIFVGKIVLMHIQSDRMAGDDCMDARKVTPLLYFGKDRYITIDPKTLTVEPRR